MRGRIDSAIHLIVVTALAATSAESHHEDTIFACEIEIGEIEKLAAGEEKVSE
jgi:uncharacterized ferredoxin-like protein